MSAEVFHRLGVALGVVLLGAWLVAGARGARQRRRVRRRLGGLVPAGADAVVAGRRLRGARVVRRWWPVGVVAVAGWVLVGGVMGMAVGTAGAVGLWRWRLRQAAAGGVEAESDARTAARQLPLAADLLAACITAGAGPVIAARAVGEALGGPVGDALARGAAEVRLGGAPAEAWRALAAAPGAAALARLLERADVSGLPAAAPVARIAADARADWARSATERARRAAVMVTAPVGLCFLPAFIAMGVLPVVIGLAGGVLGGGGG